MAVAQCASAITKALGRPPTDEEFEAIASDVQARVKAKMARGASKLDAITAVTKETTADAAVKAAHAKWVAYNNLLIGHDLGIAQTPKDVVAWLDGTSTGTSRGSGIGITTRAHTLSRNILYRMQDDIDKAGLRGMVLDRDPAWQLRVATELFRRNRPEVHPATGDPRAVAMAEAIGKGLDASRDIQNNVGAFINKLEGYMGRQNWDTMKVRGDGTDAAYAKWKETFGKNRSGDFEGLDADQIEDLLKSQWKALKSGIFNNAGANYTGGAFSLANKVSRERSINFDTPEAYVKANQLYGQGGIVQNAYAQIEQAGRNAALMEKFGTQPKKMFLDRYDASIRAASERGDEGAATALRNSRNMNTSLFNQISGLYDVPGNHSLATLGANVRAMSQLIHLGQIMNVAFVHAPINALVLRHNGVPFISALAGQLRAIFPPTAEGRIIASAANAGLDGMFGGIIRRFHTEDGTPGQMLASTVNTFYKVNGFAPFMDNQKAGVGIALTHALALLSDKEFSALPARMQVSLRRFGIEDAEWNVGRQTAQRAADGRAHIIPGDIADEAVSSKFQTWLEGQIEEGANEPTAWARNIAAAGTQPGTWAGELMRMLTQFKSFAITLAQRQWGRELRRNGLDVPGVLLLTGVMTGAGIIGNMMRGVIANKYDEMPKDAAGWAGLIERGMVNGGALGLFADAFLRDGVRSGGDFLKQLSGPALEPLIDAFGALNNVRQGPQSATGNKTRGQMALEGLHTVAGDITPNFWFTQAAYNYLMPYAVANMIRPGAVQRHERFMRQNNQDWIVPPGR